KQITSPASHDPGRLTDSAARTNVMLLIRRIVRPRPSACGGSPSMVSGTVCAPFDRSAPLTVDPERGRGAKHPSLDGSTELAEVKLGMVSRVEPVGRSGKRCLTPCCAQTVADTMGSASGADGED
ncbi:MAG: hypothetical protein ACREA0_29115, partial [bacterium]